jgi:hypothetical protein
MIWGSWWTRYESGDDDVKQDIINFAITKLTAGHTISGSNENNIADVAVLAVRLMLTFEPTRGAAINTENRLVEGYMRYVFSVPAHREYLRSDAPSEPILAEAAARFMSSIRPIRVIEKLDGWSKNGLISKANAVNSWPACCLHSHTIQ